MKWNGANTLFGLLVSGFMLLSVACSHTRTASNQLDGLSDEVATAAEVETQAEARNEAQPADSSSAEVPQAGDFSVPSDEVAVVTDAVNAPEAEEASPSPEAPSDENVAEEKDMLAMVEADLKSAMESEPAPVTTVTAKAIEPAPELASESKKTSNPNSDLEDYTKMVARSVGAAPKVEKVDPGVNSQKFAETESVADPSVAQNRFSETESVGEEDPKAQLASSDLSKVLERNLWWVFSALALGALWVFFVVRRNRKARMDSSPF